MTNDTPGTGESPSQTTRMPVAGPPIDAGSRVVVRVSRGPSPAAQSAYVNVPVLVGTAQGDALGALQEVGLSAEVFDGTSGTVPRGHVLGQLPRGGDRVEAGTEAVLRVSRGPAANPTAQVALPNVVGMTEAQATDALGRAGLTPHVLEAFSPNVPAGTVIDQLPSPASLSEAPPKKNSLLWLWIVLAVVAIGVLGFLGYRMLNRTALVPSVVGMSQADAEAAITAAGFTVGAVTTTQTASAADVGKVMAQDPAPNAEAKPRSAIAIVVSGGQKLVEVPDVTGKTESDAQAALKDAGLVAQTTTASSKDVAEGTVISQAPAAGQQVPEGTSIGITVSSGPANATVPDVTGETESDAQATLKDAGLKSQVVSNYSDATKGEVYQQVPAAGTVVAPGTVVTIHVSNGPAPAPATVTVPGVVGQTQSSATSELQGLGFKVTASQVATTGVSGQVVAQIPAANTKAPQGSTVSIVVTTTSP